MSAVYIDGNTVEWFKTLTGVKQGFLLSLHFNIMLEKFINEKLEKHVGSGNIGGKMFTNLSFVDDIDGLAG